MDRKPKVKDARPLHRRIRVLLLLFMAGVVISGLTAFPLQWEAAILDRMANAEGSPLTRIWPAMARWLALTHSGLRQSYGSYPFLAYGTDWLAFGHLVIASAFVGPLRDPVRHRWVVEWGMLACVGVIPLALICGPLRGIPFFWQLIDCSFGVLGFVPLWLCRRAILRLEALAPEATGGG